MRERGNTQDVIAAFERLSTKIDDARMFAELSDEVGGDPESLSEGEKALDTVEVELARMEKLRMLSGEHDTFNAIVTIKPGAGGTESQDWASILYRMYLRYCEQQGWETEVTDYQDGDEAGIKMAEFRVVGPYAFGHLKAESGVHRLVRISPFDANKRRHTSFAAVSVIPEIDDNIVIEVKESDLRVDTYRASGAGGQHVNRTDSAVRLTHKPTGVVVACQAERSQHKNRDKAMKMLRAKLYELELRKREEKAAEAHSDEAAVAFGSQIRSYVLHPYKQIKDLRTGYTVGNVDSVLDGKLDGFVEAYLLKAGSGEPLDAVEDID
jgi:peptide chain release factor 2